MATCRATTRLPCQVLTHIWKGNTGPQPLVLKIANRTIPQSIQKEGTLPQGEGHLLRSSLFEAENVPNSKLMSSKRKIRK